MNTKICTKCGIEKDIEEFPLRNQFTLRRQSVKTVASYMVLSGMGGTKTIKRLILENTLLSTVLLRKNMSGIIY